MVSRRSLLALLSSSLAGCLGSEGPSTSPTKRNSTVSTRTKSTPTRTGTDPPSTPTSTSPEEWPPPEWNADWHHDLAAWGVLGLDFVDDRLIITAGAQNEKTVIESFNPTSRTVDWTRELAGGSAADSVVRREGITRSWGVSRVGESLLAVTESQDNSGSKLHALNRETGEREWSIQREKRLLVRGIANGVVYVVGKEFRKNETSHPHGSDTPTPVPRDAELLAVDQTDGSIRWSRRFTGVGDVRADDRGVYVAEMNRVAAFGHNGDRMWTVRGDHRGDAVFPGEEIIFFVTKPRWDRMFVRGVTPSGEVRWRKRFDADAALLYEGDLYVARDSLWALRADGSIRWRSPGRAFHLVFNEDGDEMYVRTGKRADAVDVVALDDGYRRWRFDPPISNASPRVASAGTLVAGGIGDSGTPLYRVDTSHGRATGRHLGEHFGATPKGDHVFVGTQTEDIGARVLALPL